MMSEVFGLYQAIKKAGIKISDRHPALQDVTGDGFLLRIDDAGKIAAASYFDAREQPLWKIAPDNQNSFPAFKLYAPILSPPPGSVIPLAVFDLKKKLSEVAEILVEAAASWDLIYSKKQLVKFWGRYQELPSKLLKVPGAILPEDEALSALLANLAAAGDFTEEKARRKLRDIVRALADAAAQGRIETMARVAALLIGKPDKKTKTLKEERDVTVWLDNFPDSIADYRRMTPLVSRWLFSQDERSDGEHEPKIGICALSGGAPQILVSGTFPQVNLPVFQQKTALMAMNKDIPCHYRYSAIAADICPVGRALACDLANTLRWITDESRKYQTWSPVPSGKWSGKKQQYDLLIVYLEEKPDLNAGFASCITGSETDKADNAEADFTAATKTVVEALRTQRPTDWQNDSLRCFILREIDPGRRQVVYNECFTVKAFFDAADEWQKAAQNGPRFVLWLPVEKGQPARQLEAAAPFLTRIVEMFQQQWIRDGLECNKTHGVSLADVVTLFLMIRHGDTAIVERMLQMELVRVTSLLIAVGQAMHGGNFAMLKTDVKRTALDAVSLLRILLYKLKIEKETYMSDNPYLLGRLLAATDILYREYNKIERDEKNPSRLLGSSYVQVIADNPARGLAQLAERLPLYTDWARRMPESGQYGLAHWSLNLLGQISAAINHDELTSKKMEDKEKAQFLLGYLCNFSKNDEQA